MSDYRGNKIRFDAALRQAYLAIDHTKCRRIAKQLIDGNHLNHYGLDSAKAVVIAAADQVTKAVIIRPSAKLARYQRANTIVATKQLRTINAVEGFTNQVSSLVQAKNKIANLEARYSSASRKQRRNIKYVIHAIKQEFGL